MLRVPVVAVLEGHGARPCVGVSERERERDSEYYRSIIDRGRGPTGPCGIANVISTEY